jgi:predicted TIM-barrel fold metal-dependent hydrolase
MIIDVHGHPDWQGHNLEKFLANAAQFGIDKTWLLTWEAPADEYDPRSYPDLPRTGDGPIPFDLALSYVQRAPEKFVLGYAPDPRRPEAIDHLKAMVAIYGVRIYGELKLRMMYDNLDALRMYRYCGEAKLPVLVHLDYEFDSGYPGGYPRPSYWYGGGIEALERALQACPETIFIGHAPGFWAHISNDGLEEKEPYPTGPIVRGGKIEQYLRKYPNLYCETSAGSGWNALNRDRAFTHDFLTEFQDRVMYGRDGFDNRHQELLNSLGLPAEVLGKIYAGNARKLMGE